MRIDHVFHNLNLFGGAEEHITSLAALQKAQGDDVSLCLVQAVDPQNQYAQRLNSAGVTICQWPLWLSRLSGDWNTREKLLRLSIILLNPLITLVVFFMKLFSTRSQYRMRESVEGRVRTILGRLLDPSRERQLFLLLLRWRYHTHKPDLLHVHSYGSGLEFILEWAHIYNIPVVYQEHSTPDLTNRRSYKLPTQLNLARILVAVSEASAKGLRHLCGVTQPIQVIPPIVTVTTQEDEIRQGSVLGSSNIHILTIARLSIEKGLHYLIRAAEQVIGEKPNVRFKIYGEGYLRESLEAEINTPHLCGKIHLTGSFTREELPSIMSEADIFVLPSITEGFPLSVIEAMAWGLPIVATAVGGLPELIEDGVTGLLCPAQNEDALARAVLTLINNPAHSNAIGVAAQKMYNSKFTPQAILDRFGDVYSQASKTSSVGQSDDSLLSL